MDFIKKVWNHVFGTDTDFNETSLLYNLVVVPLSKVLNGIMAIGHMLYDPEDATNYQDANSAFLIAANTAALNGVSVPTQSVNAKVIFAPAGGTDTPIDIYPGQTFVFTNDDQTVSVTASSRKISRLRGAKTLWGGVSGYITDLVIVDTMTEPQELSGMTLYQWPDSLNISTGKIISANKINNPDYRVLLDGISKISLTKKNALSAVPDARELSILAAGSEYASDIIIQSGDGSAFVYNVGFVAKESGDTDINPNCAYFAQDQDQEPDITYMTSDYELTTPEYAMIAMSDNYDLIINVYSVLDSDAYSTTKVAGFPDGYFGGLHGFPPGSLLTGQEVRQYNGYLIVGTRAFSGESSPWDDFQDRLVSFMLPPSTVSQFKKNLYSVLSEFVRIDDRTVIDTMISKITSQVGTTVQEGVISLLNTIGKPGEAGKSSAEQK